MHMAQTQGAIRFRQFYQRMRSGLVVLPVEVDATALADVLIESRLLDPTVADDRAALAKATTRLIEIFCQEKSIRRLQSESEGSLPAPRP